MMTDKLRTALNGGGFYAVLALCVLAVGVGGWFALFRQEEAPDPAVVDVLEPSPYVTVTEPPKAADVSGPAEISESEPVPAPVSVPAPMPELEIDPTPVTAEEPRLIVSPLRGDVVTVFAMDDLIYSETLADWRTHDGIDIAAAQGTTVLAASSGTVFAVEEDPMMGTTVVIDQDDGCRAAYANLQTRPNVREGERVSAGQIIGAVGSTAAAESAQTPHLHFSISRNGEPVNPEEYLSK